MPLSRGPLSAALSEDLLGHKALRPSTIACAADACRRRQGNPLTDEDLQLTLTLCYELHYQGIDGVDDAWEWEPTLLTMRRVVEQAFQAALCAQVALPMPTGEPIGVQLRRLVTTDGGPSLSHHLQHAGTLMQYREFVAHRSIYHLKEADPHTWAIPRVTGRTKAALVEIQADEYGGGRPERMHNALFARAMRALSLDDTYGYFVDEAPASTLCTVNLASFFGLHRRLRGAVLGHLAVLEMDSSVPNRRYGDGLRRLGFGHDATWFYDEHVQADAVHEQLAAVDMCGSFVAAEPERLPDVLFGAAACLAIEGGFADALLNAWRSGRSSLRQRPRHQDCRAAGHRTGSSGALPARN